MCKLFKKLPKNIIIIIFQYDNTFHIIYKKLLNEFIEKTKFWKLKWINKQENYGGDIDDSTDFNFFESSYKQLEFCYNYWNKIYPITYSRLSINYNCDIEFITDELISSKYLMKKLKNN